MASSDDHNAFHDDRNDSSIISVRLYTVLQETCPVLKSFLLCSVL